MDNKDVNWTGESIPLILTHFMIMKGTQRMIMIKRGGLPYCCVSTSVELDHPLQALSERITSNVKICKYIKQMDNSFAANRASAALHVNTA